MSTIKEMFNNQALTRELLLDHYQYPHNHELSDNKSYLSKHMSSASCIDDITVQVDIKDNIIQDVRFDGVACTISTASTSIMTDLLKGKTIEEAEKIIGEYNKMINNEEYDDELLQEANAFQNVYKQANRIKCATIGWDAVQELIERNKKDVQE